MKYEFLCVGNAIVDLIAQVNEEFIDQNGLEKGSMALVNAEESARRLGMTPDVLMEAGGSAANTAACLASLGNKVAFVGKVGNDTLGSFFKESMSNLGIDFICRDDHDDVATANCLAVVTPDGERTMSTFLGACTHLGPEDIDEDIVASAGCIFIEGYLLDSPSATSAVDKLLEIAARREIPVALTLSDANCVRRHHAKFLEIEQHPRCIVVIANEKEMSAMRSTDSVLDAVFKCRDFPALSVVTLGKHGSVVVDADNVEKFEAEPVEKIVDLVGAGDAFAAGFLHTLHFGVFPGLGFSPKKQRVGAAMGAKCAAVVISGKGARPSVNLAMACGLEICVDAA